MTAEERLKQMQQEEEDGEVDLHLQEYKQRRLEARRSPYPSVVVEVRAMAPPKFTPPAAQQSSESRQSGNDERGRSVDDEEVTADVINALEALFSKSSLENQKGGSTSFYESIGTHLEEVSSVTPMSMAQNWIASNDDKFDAAECAFTTSDAAHVDEAYEFLFTNLAMQTTQFLDGANTTVDSGAAKRQYLVMPNFLASSATSMEKFVGEVQNILSTLPPLRDVVKVSCHHPEHVDESRRCPVPTLVLSWQD